MAIYNLSEVKPSESQFCLVKAGESWKFCVYQTDGTFLFPVSSGDVGEYEEWQPAFLVMGNACLNPFDRKVMYDLTDIVNEEKESYWDDFLKAVEVLDVERGRGDGNSKGCGENVPAEIPVL